MAEQALNVKDGHDDFARADLVGCRDLGSRLEILALAQGSRLDPTADHFNLGGAELFAAHWHRAGTHFSQKQASNRHTRDKRRPGLATLQNAVASPQVKLRLLKVFAVAGQAMGLKDGSDVGFEARDVGALARQEAGGECG